MSAVAQSKRSKGSEALSSLVSRYKTAKKLAEAVGVGEDRISVWSRGLHRPDIEARRLFIPFGIGLFDWDEDPINNAESEAS